MESHKRVVGILYIVTGILQFIGMLLLSVLISSLIPFIADSAEENTRWVFEWIIVLFSIPSIIGGGALLQGKSWALTLVLILGCFKLFSFPIGTAIGIYTIWVYAEDKKSVSEKTA
jgi:hypothetical protein